MSGVTDVQDNHFEVRVVDCVKKNKWIADDRQSSYTRLIRVMPGAREFSKQYCHFLDAVHDRSGS